MNVIIIPAYEPNESLIHLVCELKAADKTSLVVIDDGSNETYQPIFKKIQDLGFHVFHHEKNMGKGAAIKTGIIEANKIYDEISFYITCDADGQHLVKDILKIDQAAHKDFNQLILGARKQKKNSIPLRSRFGNWFSALYFRFSTGVILTDTQTGLRAIPFNLTDEALQIKENRYDYEMQFLMKIAKSSYPIHVIPIETIYINQNETSHFKPFVDSIRIYKQPLRFTIASLSSALIDLGIFTILFILLNGHILRAVTIASVTARLISGGYNFLLNRLWSFNNRSNTKQQIIRYGILYMAQLLSSIALVYILSSVFKFITIGKMIVDGTLFIISYFIQKHWVFKKKST